MNPYFVGLIVPIAVSLLLEKRRNVEKKRGVPVDVGGEPGYAIRNYRFELPVETHWEGVSTLAELFEQSCKEFVYMPLLGTRKLISRETELASDGRSFEKLHLGEYEWKCYAEAFKSVCNFSSGLIRLGHQRSERVAIFAETQAEWQIALQACFRQNITVVTIYASLGEGALCHSLNETEVTTVVCGQKEIKRLIDISGQLDTVKRVIYINEEGISTEVYLAQNCTAGIRTITSSGVYREAEVYDRYIDLRAIPELNSVSKDAECVEIGAVILISWVIEILRGEGDGCKDVAFGKIADHMEKVASHFVRNMASLGGNLIMAQRDEFASDIAMILLAAGSLVCIQLSSERLNITLEEFLEMPPCDYNTLLLSIYIPHCTPNGVSSSVGTANTARDKAGSSLQFETYGAAPRPLGNAVSYLNSAFLAQVSSDETSGSLMLDKLCLAFGAYGPVAMMTILLYRLGVKPHSRREECYIPACLIGLSWAVGRGPWARMQTGAVLQRERVTTIEGIEDYSVSQRLLLPPASSLSPTSVSHSRFLVLPLPPFSLLIPPQIHINCIPTTCNL